MFTRIINDYSIPQMLRVMGLMPNCAGLLGSFALLGVSDASPLGGSSDMTVSPKTCDGLWNGLATNSPARGLSSASSASSGRGSELDIWSCIFWSWMHCDRFGAENLERRRALPLGGVARAIAGP